MNEIEEIVSEIQKNKDIADTEKGIVELDNPHTQRIRLGHVKKAKENLEQLYRDYRKSIQRRSVFIVVTGKQGSDFAKIAQEEFECFSVDADSFYKDIINTIPEVLWKDKTTSPALFDYFMAKFEDRATVIEIIGFPALIFDAKYKKVLKTEEDLLSVLKEAFNEKVGSEVVAYDAIDKAAEKAVEKGYTGKLAAITLHSNDPKLVKDFIKNFGIVTKNIFIVTTGTKVDKEIKTKATAHIKTVNKESVQKTLLQIRDNLS